MYIQCFAIVNLKYLLLFYDTEFALLYNSCWNWRTCTTVVKCEPIDLQKLYSLEKLKYSLIFKVKIPRFLGLLYKKKTLGCPEVAVDTSKNLWQFS